MSARCLRCRYAPIDAGADLCPACGASQEALGRGALPPGTTLRGWRYRIDCQAGRGAIAVIYRASSTGRAQPVAIKEFFPLAGADRAGGDEAVHVVPRDAEKFRRERGRFMREGAILAALPSGSGMEALDLFEENGTGYIVMDYVEGQTLSAILRRRSSGHLEESEVEAVVGRLVQSLEAMHGQEIYHLDIAPDNVLYTPEGMAVLIDFGAARQGRTAGGGQPFKFEYAPLEAITDGDVGPESDLFELAMMTHELLTGVRPLPALQRIGVPHISLPALTEPWRALLEGALHLSPEERPHSVRAWWEGRGRNAAATMSTL